VSTFRQKMRRNTQREWGDWKCTWSGLKWEDSVRMYNMCVLMQAGGTTRLYWEVEECRAVGLRLSPSHHPSTSDQCAQVYQGIAVIKYHSHYSISTYLTLPDLRQRWGLTTNPCATPTDIRRLEELLLDWSEPSTQLISSRHEHATMCRSRHLSIATGLSARDVPSRWVYQHICRARCMLSPVRMSVCLSHGYRSVKNVEVRNFGIMQLAPQSSPVRLVFAVYV